MSTDDSNYLGMGPMVHYGGAPMPMPEVPQPRKFDPPEFLPPERVVERVVVAPAEKRKVTVAARIDEYGQPRLRLTVDGVHVAEVQGDAKSLTLTEEI